MRVSFFVTRIFRFHHRYEDPDHRRYWSVRINQQWRVTFRWKDADAYEVRIEDYHKG